MVEIKYSVGQVKRYLKIFSIGAGGMVKLLLKLAKLIN